MPPPLLEKGGGEGVTVAVWWGVEAQWGCCGG